MPPGRCSMARRQIGIHCQQFVGELLHRASSFILAGKKISGVPDVNCDQFIVGPYKLGIRFHRAVEIFDCQSMMLRSQLVVVPASQVVKASGFGFGLVTVSGATSECDHGAHDGKDEDCKSDVFRELPMPFPRTGLFYRTTTL